MSKKTKKIAVFRQYFYAILSISLVLLLIGVYGTVVLSGQRAVTAIKENLEVIVELSPDAVKAEQTAVREWLQQQIYVKDNTIRFVSKTEGLKQLKEQFGSSLIVFDFENPLYDVLTFHVQPTFAQSDSLKRIKMGLMQHKKIQDVHYQDAIIGSLEKNAQQFSGLLIGISALLLLIAVALINNTVRLSLYDSRFILKNMQYVGAKEGFIMKPYLRKAMFNGFLSAGLAVVGILGILYLVQQQMPKLLMDIFTVEIFLLFAAITLLGLLISGGSTFFAVKRFLRKRESELY